MTTAISICLPNTSIRLMLNFYHVLFLLCGADITLSLTCYFGDLSTVA